MNSNDILIANTDDLRSDMNYLEKTLLKGHRIDPNLYEEYDVRSEERRVGKECRL